MDRRKMLFFIFMFIIIIIIIVSLTVYLVELSNEKKIEAGIDKSLVPITTNAALVEDFIKVLEIVDSESYKSIKRRVKPILSGELQDKYFPTDFYNLSDRPKTEVEVKEIKYLLNEESNKGSYTYKVGLTIRSDKILEIVLLVTVKNGKIINSEKL